jgi:hypothetical protein
VPLRAFEPCGRDADLQCRTPYLDRTVQPIGHDGYTSAGVPNSHETDATCTAVVVRAGDAAGEPLRRDWRTPMTDEPLGHARRRLASEQRADLDQLLNDLGRLRRDIDDTLQEAIRREAYIKGYRDGYRARRPRWWR